MLTDLKKYEVSVILTMYNCRKYFPRAIRSLINQTFKDYELIIVDDGSSDNPEEDIFPLLKSGDNYKYIRHSNRKHPLSLNTGILLSSGTYITFLDCDDEYMPGHLSERVNYFSLNPQTDLIHSPASLVGEHADFFVPDANNPDRLIHLNDCIIGGTLFGKRKVFTELNGFKNIYSHDSDFYNRASQIYNVALFNSKTYIYYRNNPESVISIMKQNHESKL